MSLGRGGVWRWKNGLHVLAACATALLLASYAAVSHGGCHDAAGRPAGAFSVVAGHGDSPATPEQDARPAILDAEGSVDEIEMRESSSHAAAKERSHGPDSRFPGRDHPNVAIEQSALVANAADLGRLCRLLI